MSGLDRIAESIRRSLAEMVKAGAEELDEARTHRRWWSEFRAAEDAVRLYPRVDEEGDGAPPGSPARVA